MTVALPTYSPVPSVCNTSSSSHPPAGIKSGAWKRRYFVLKVRYGVACLARACLPVGRLRLHGSEDALLRAPTCGMHACVGAAGCALLGPTGGDTQRCALMA